MVKVRDCIKGLEPDVSQSNGKELNVKSVACEGNYSNVRCWYCIYLLLYTKRGN